MRRACSSLAHRGSKRVPRGALGGGVRHGVTLVELMVVILLLGLLSGVVGLTMGSNPHVASLDPIAVAVMQARDSALSTGHRVTISLRVDGRSRSATAFPDGRVLTDAPIEIDPLSGSAGRGTASSEHASTQPGAGDAEH